MAEKYAASYKWAADEGAYIFLKIIYIIGRGGGGGGSWKRLTKDRLFLDVGLI